MTSPLFRNVDCLRLPVSDIDGALSFYRDRLGHDLIWRTSSAVGLRLGDSEAELVLHTEGDPPEVDLKVESVTEAVAAFQAAGGKLILGPFEIRIGQCAIVHDPWGNRLVLLDVTKGLLQTDDNGNVVD
jgi:predicted enzyme related to lactoylglutathione lyase